MFDQFSVLLQVILVDLVLAGDNAIVIGLVASTFPDEMRRKIIIYGLALAAILRIAFTLVTAQLLTLPYLKLIGGILLLWVCWTLWRDFLRSPNTTTSGRFNTPTEQYSVRRAAIQIILADFSMSLDNILAVAGVAWNHPVILFIGLALSILLMAVSATVIARLLEKFRWLAYLGIAVIFYVAVTLINADIKVLPLA